MIIFALKSHLMVKKLFYVNKILKIKKKKKKEKERENLVIMEGVKIWFKNYYALTSFMWFPLTLAFRPQGRYKYRGMNDRLLK